MPEFLITSTDRDGCRITDICEADWAHDAAAMLEAAGHTDIDLLTEDTMAASNSANYLSQQMKRLGGRVTPSDLALLYGKSELKRDLWLTRLIVKSFWYVYAVAIPLLVLNHLRDHPWYWATAILVIAMLGVPVWAFLTLRTGSRVELTRLARAIVWRRPDEASAGLERLRHLISEERATFYAARIAALRGEIDRGVRILAPLANDPHVPDWHYFNMLSMVYLDASEWQHGIETGDQAVALAPRNAATILGQANLLLLHSRDVERAKAMFEQAIHLHMHPLSKPYVTYGRALVALRSGDPRAAIDACNDALEQFRSLPQIKDGADELMDAVVHGVLCVANANINNIDEARRCFEVALPLLEARGRSPIYDEMKASLARSAPAS
ncbi:MAG: hypothetical protein GC159_05720 [Phycisphaera sp.]|nr:hypothetical protein [Phycisphaera sp.]